ncbi:thioesterase superfamily protein [Hymenobacter roseosalivarius DSM 11622]|uniref:Thioesterase superfamily protein n=1 Tax=Hymenobacter roseosalivarius DSM 11622 TaxID=645990 RepID=A0A1W1UN26_9BACT|nr:acyl-CoA thioesterase [Hymenobacter roseosalivarius]SMB82535.1 thioesterase superfamily protein [Hymenobacter roseosalivarius DSM 11622]
MSTSLLPDFRLVSHSRVTLTELMIPSYANLGGKIHGGILLSLMDKVAYAAAAKHAGTYCVTVSVDGVNFLQPVEVGELVSLLASVNYVGRTSLVIGIKVIAEDVRTGTVKHTNTSYFTMVAKDDDGRPTPVPGLVLETPDDTRRFLESIKRKELKAQFSAEFDNARSLLAVAQQLDLLGNENCQLGY